MKKRKYSLLELAVGASPRAPNNNNKRAKTANSSSSKGSGGPAETKWFYLDRKAELWRCQHCPQTYPELWTSGPKVGTSRRYSMQMHSRKHKKAAGITSCEGECLQRADGQGRCKLCRDLQTKGENAELDATLAATASALGRACGQALIAPLSALLESPKRNKRALRAVSHKTRSLVGRVTVPAADHVFASPAAVPEVIRDAVRAYVLDKVGVLRADDGKQTPTVQSRTWVDAALAACAMCCRNCMLQWHNVATNVNLGAAPYSQLLANCVDLLLEWYLVKSSAQVSKAIAKKAPKPPSADPAAGEAAAAGEAKQLEKKAIQRRRSFATPAGAAAGNKPPAEAGRRRGAYDDDDDSEMALELEKDDAEEDGSNDAEMALERPLPRVTSDLVRASNPATTRHSSSSSSSSSSSWS